MAAEGALELYKVCAELVQGEGLKMIFVSIDKCQID